MISINQLKIQNLTEILCNAFDIEDAIEIKKTKQEPILLGKIAGILYFDTPSINIPGFEAAVYKLGGDCIIYKKDNLIQICENDIDIVKVYDKYCDLLIINHPKKCFFENCISEIETPIINAGNGFFEHPVHALTDLFTILHYHIPPIKLIFSVENLANPYFNSLIKLVDLLYTNIEIICITNDKVAASMVNCSNNKIIFCPNITSAILDAHVWYIAFNDNHITNEILNLSSNDLIIINSQDQIGKLPIILNNNQKSKCYDQIGYSVYLNMAILIFVMNNK